MHMGWKLILLVVLASCNKDIKNLPETRALAPEAIACPESPFFPTGPNDPTCSLARQPVPCACSEVLFWDDVNWTTIDPQNTCFAKYYNIYAKAAGTTEWGLAGTTKWRANSETYANPANPGNCFEDDPRPECGELVRPKAETRWFMAWLGIGLTNPSTTWWVDNQLYDLSVKACQACAADHVERCSLGYSNIVQYKSAPYACYENGHQVPCGTNVPLRY